MINNYGFGQYNHAEDCRRDLERLQEEEELRMKKLRDTPFHKYFLEAQKKGFEVYVGEGIALVVYEDGTIGVQLEEPYWYKAVFLNKDLRDNEDEIFLKEIRAPENRKGIRKSLTGKLYDLYHELCAYHESEDGSCLNTAMISLGLEGF